MPFPINKNPNVFTTTKVRGSKLKQTLLLEQIKGDLAKIDIHVMNDVLI